MKYWIIVTFILTGVWTTSAIIAGTTLSDSEGIGIFTQAVGGRQAEYLPQPEQINLSGPSFPMSCAKKIWYHNYAAFTDLIQFRGNLYTTFREGNAHTTHSSDPFYGQIRVLESKDNGITWNSVAVIKEYGKDFRDPKLSITPDGKLMINMGCTWNHDNNVYRRQPHVSFSVDGKSWTQALPCLLMGNDVSHMDWLWQVTWHKGVAYAASYQGGSNKLILFKSTDGIIWYQITVLKSQGFANETVIRFDGDTMILLIREGHYQEHGKSHLGTADPPYTEWNWRLTDLRLGGPCFLILPNGDYLVATRSYDENKTGCALYIMTPAGKSRKLYAFQAGGDCGYPGLVAEKDVLYVSYYSSHQGAKSSIYFQSLSLMPLLMGKLHEPSEKI